MSRQVIVLGNHRTGSSCLAGVLSKLGISMGYDMLGAHPSNPGGHYEDQEFLLINDAVIGHWENPRTCFEGKELEELQSTYEQLIQRRNLDFRMWGMKDPRLCILLRVMLPLLHDPVVLHIVRDYQASIKSLSKRERWSAEKAEIVLGYYMEEKERTLATLEEAAIPIRLVCFEALVEDPEDTIKSFLSMVYSRWDDGLWPSPFLIANAARHVNPEFVHYE